MKISVATKSVAEKRVPGLTPDTCPTPKVHAQTSQAASAEICTLKELVARSKNKLKTAEYERDGARAWMQRLHCEPSELQSATSCIRNHISALTGGLGNDCDHSVKHQDKYCERMFIELQKLLSGQVM